MPNVISLQVLDSRVSIPSARNMQTYSWLRRGLLDLWIKKEVRLQTRDVGNLSRSVCSISTRSTKIIALQSPIIPLQRAKQTRKREREREKEKERKRAPTSSKGLIPWANIFTPFYSKPGRFRMYCQFCIYTPNRFAYATHSPPPIVSAFYRSCPMNKFISNSSFASSSSRHSRSHLGISHLFMILTYTIFTGNTRYYVLTLTLGYLRVSRLWGSDDRS